MSTPTRDELARLIRSVSQGYMSDTTSGFMGGTAGAIIDPFAAADAILAAYPSQDGPSAICGDPRWEDTNCAVGEPTGICGRYLNADGTCPRSGALPFVPAPTHNETGNGDDELAEAQRLSPGRLIAMNRGLVADRGVARKTANDVLRWLAERTRERDTARAEADTAMEKYAETLADLAEARTDLTHLAQELAGLRERIEAILNLHRDRMPTAAQLWHDLRAALPAPTGPTAEGETRP